VGQHIDDVAEVLRAAHDARRRRDWTAAYERLTTALATAMLSADDLEALSDVA
jgi:hypothetical protein